MWLEVLKKPRYVDEELMHRLPLNASTPARSICRTPSIWGSAHIVAVRVPFSTAVPQKAVLDIDHCLLCGKCEQACPVAAIDFTQTPASDRD